MEIILNGESAVVEDNLTVRELLRQLGKEPRYVAVERNHELIPRRAHAECVIEPGDRVEIVTLVGGG